MQGNIPETNYKAMGQARSAPDRVDLENPNVIVSGLLQMTQKLAKDLTGEDVFTEQLKERFSLEIVAAMRFCWHMPDLHF